MTNAHNRELPDLAKLRDYNDGRQPLSHLHAELLDTLDDRVRQLVEMMEYGLAVTDLDYDGYYSGHG